MKLGKMALAGLVLFVLTVIISPLSASAQSEDMQKAPLTQRSVTAAQLPAFEFTNTIDGQARVVSAAKRWRDKYGISIDLNKIRVFNIGTEDAPDIIVLSDMSLFESATTTINADGSAAASMQVTTAGTVPQSQVVGSEDATIQSQSWIMVAQACFERMEYVKGYIDHCCKIHKLEGDVSSTKDYFQLEHFATAKSHWPWILQEAKLSSAPHENSSTMEWVDWSPRGDIEHGGCQSYEVGISVGEIGINSTYTQCDKWDMTKGVTPGNFGNFWIGYSHQQDREIAYMQAVAVPQGGWPQWYLSANILA